jgi:hypothetical protein
MIRLFYRCILRLHPARFRERFAAEMLEIFDEAKGAASYGRYVMRQATIADMITTAYGLKDSS